MARNLRSRGWPANRSAAGREGWWERQDSNLRRRKPADLQSAPFATRDTLPNRRIALISKDKRARPAGRFGISGFMVSHRVEVNGGRFSPHVPTIAVNRWDEPDPPQCLTAIANGPIHAKDREQSRARRTSSVERRERFERARRDTLRPDDDIATLVRLAHREGGAGKSGAERPQAARDRERRPPAGRGKRDARRRRPRSCGLAPSRSGFRPTQCIRGSISKPIPCPRRRSNEIAPQGVVLVLDQITDPHNVGAIFRSAAAFAASAIVTTARHSPEATGVLAKSASGALEHVPLDHGAEPVARIGGAQGARLLRGRARTPAATATSPGWRCASRSRWCSAPRAVVCGNSRKETCDHVARLELPGAIKSLNVSNAAALALYIASAKLCG